MEFTSLSISGVEIIVARDDLNHATVSGNKLHKLTPNIRTAIERGCSTILSFGGAYSNHLHALAWACKQSGLTSIGIVRGELHANLTPTLQDCKTWGMQLIPSTRKDYRRYQELLHSVDEPCLANELSVDLSSIDLSLEHADKTLVIPEGGSNALAIESLSSAYQEIFKSPYCHNVSHAICATGTGATVAGLYSAAPEQVKVIGIQAVAEHEATFARIRSWLKEKPENLTIEQGHLGGFGKQPSQLLEFIEQFETRYSIPIDPIYNGKVMFKVCQMIDAGAFKKTDKILIINTGGLQGKRNND